MMTSPDRITVHVRKLCRKLGNVGEPVFVDVHPRLDSDVNDCFCDVERQVAEAGGSVQYGWLIWEMPGVFIEGEFHAVWKKPDGVLLDVSFKRDGETKVCFVSDNERMFKEQRVPTIRHAISDDPLVKRFITISSRFQSNVARKYHVPFGSPINFDAEDRALEREIQILGVQMSQLRAARRHAK